MLILESCSRQRVEHHEDKWERKAAEGAFSLSEPKVVLVGPSRRYLPHEKVLLSTFHR